MRFFSKNTQTLIASLISVILLFIYPNLTQSQAVFATYDPLSVSNNRFGIHLIQATHDEASPAASLVNSTGGDWGYVTVLIEGKDKNQGKWQEFFNELRRKHLIPIVRLASIPDGNVWKIPDIGEAQNWADFLDSLIWPTKNRYVVIYNEPNQAHEWGGQVDASSYAETLDQTITALKSKSQDFYVLNAGLDASAPEQMPNYEDEAVFLREMNISVPGIFDRLDGWVSHPYPNPGFVGSPDATGRGTVRTWQWELQQLKGLGVTKTLPVFITETGWKHAEGMNYDFSLPDATTVSKYFEKAFNQAWNSNKIVAVTPFLLSYQEKLFDHFSFKRLDGISTDPGFYPQYQAILSMAKTAGKPVQENKAKLMKGEVYSSIVAGESYNISITFQNTGQSTWGDSNFVSLVTTTGSKELGIDAVELPKDKKIEPGQEYTFNLKLKAPLGGTFKVVLNLFDGNKPFDTQPVEFTTVVKSPVILRIKSLLGWKKDFSGSYTLNVKGPTGESSKNVTLDKNGLSGDMEIRYLLPDYFFEFSLEKPFYLSKTINQKLNAGVNTLDFGTLQPDIISALLHPKQLWQLLPFSN